MAISILDILPVKPMINITDIGAMIIPESPPSYQPLIDAGLANVVGFEPVPEELARLRASAKAGMTFLPHAVGDGTRRPFHICKFPMNSSLLRPNYEVCSHFDTLTQLMQIERTIDIQTSRLDDIPEIQKTDLLKIDIQGGELMAFQAAQHVLKSTVMVLTEVEFIPLYQDQPLFADIDAFMRQSGFLLHQIGPACGRPFLPMRHIRSDPRYPQFIWADATYFRDFRKFNELQPDKLLKIAILADLLPHSYDLALKCLVMYDELMGTNLGSDYIQMMQRAS
jgi:FkbM family methyltransferase